jgi:outer membrane lipoprotein-sorting protein
MRSGAPGPRAAALSARTAVLGLRLWARTAVLGLRLWARTAALGPALSARPAVLGLALLGCGTGRAAAADLDEIMHLLAARRHGEVSFAEQQFVSLLKHPVESSGELVYDAPGRLEKRTLEPHLEILVLDGGVLTLRRGHRSQVLDLKAYPQVLPFVEGIRATLAGDRNALERVFHVEFAGDVGHWTLTLVPRDGDPKTVAQVRIDGARAELSKVEIRQADGDRSVMTLAHPNP